MDLNRIYRSPTVGRIADWTSIAQTVVAGIGLFGGSAFLSWIASTIEPIMRYGWGAVVFAGLITACLAALTLTSIIITIRIFPGNILRPTQNSQNAQIDKGSSSGAAVNTENGSTNELNSIIDLITSYNDNSYSKIHALSGETTELRDSISKINDALRPNQNLTPLARLGKNIVNAESRFDSIESMLECHKKDTLSSEKELIQKFTELDTRLNESIASIFEKFTKITDTFLAERIFESYTHMSADIAEILKKLDDPLSKPDMFQDWAKWESLYDELKSRIRTLARFLHSQAGISTKFFDTPTERYSSQNWTYDFRDMDDDQKLNYKTFRIIYDNYINQSQEVRSRLYNATFPNF